MRIASDVAFYEVNAPADEWYVSGGDDTGEDAGFGDRLAAIWAEELGRLVFAQAS